MGLLKGRAFARKIAERKLATLLLAAFLLSVVSTQYAGAQQALPSATATALNGSEIVLPRDLSPATVMIVGFTRGSADATTAWEIPVRTKLAGGPVGFYDVAVLASVPGFLHGWVIHTLRGKVPDVLKGRFLPVFADEAGWKQVCGYDTKAPDAAYVLLVDRSGKVLWRTHEPFSPAGFGTLVAVLHKADQARSSTRQ